MLALPNLPNNHLASIAHYFPGLPIENDYFEALPNFDADSEWIVKNTGVLRRHWPDESVERPVEMAAHAAKDALRKANITADQVDVLIGTTSTTRPKINPSTLSNNYMDIALPLQPHLGACAGFVYSSAVAVSLLATLGKKTALVVCAENPRPILNFDYKYSALFGGGATASVWTIGGDMQGLQDVVLHADGRYFNAFDIDDNHKIMIKGNLIGKLGPSLLASAVTELLERNNLTKSDINWFIPHQGNLNMISEVCQILEIDPSITLTNIHNRGNTSSVSIPSCLSENIERGLIKRGDRILSVTIGRGLSWGGMLLNV